MSVNKNPAHHSLHSQEIQSAMDVKVSFSFLSLFLTKPDKANSQPAFYHHIALFLYHFVRKGLLSSECVAFEI